MLLTKDQLFMTEIRKGHEFNKKNLEDFMKLNIKNFQEPLIIKQFTNGQSNPTFYLKDSKGNEFVLRKKPPGKLLKSAHMVFIYVYLCLLFIRLKENL